MTAPVLLQSWKRTETYILQAISALQESTRRKGATEIAQATAYLEHNELGLAFETLFDLCMSAGGEKDIALELLALAAASMELEEEMDQLDRTLTIRKGTPHKTSLPPEAVSG